MILRQRKIPISEWKAHKAAHATDSETLLYALMISTLLGTTVAQNEFIAECQYPYMTHSLALSVPC